MTGELDVRPRYQQSRQNMYSDCVASTSHKGTVLLIFSRPTSYEEIGKEDRSILTSVCIEMPVGIESSVLQLGYMSERKYEACYRYYRISDRLNSTSTRPENSYSMSYIVDCYSNEIIINHKTHKMRFFSYSAEQIYQNILPNMDTMVQKIYEYMYICMCAYICVCA